MTLPRPPEKWSSAWQSALNVEIERQLRQKLERNADIEMPIIDTGAERHARVILRSPDGSRWKLVVSNAGALSVEAL